jgi:hypothetical protein
MGDWTNRCGTESWRTNPDMSIELETAEGIPLYAPTSSTYTVLTNVWRNWASIARWAAKRSGIPTSWVIGFICAETGNWAKDPAVEAYCGPWSTVCHNPCCAGPMQVMVTPYPNYKTYGGYPNATDMQDPAKAIDTGAKMLARMAQNSNVQGELPALAATYNSGGVYCDGQNEFGLRSDSGYIRRVVTFNNTAIAALNVNRDASLVRDLLLAGAFLGAGYLSYHYL